MNAPDRDRFGNMLHIRTDFNPDEIRQMVEWPDSGRSMLDDISTRVLDLREMEVRRALCRLGWTPPTEYRAETAARMQREDASRQRIVRLLRSIERIAGNQPDCNLETRTGPNDAAMRGLWVVGARQLAQEALCELGEKTEDFNRHD